MSQIHQKLVAMYKGELILPSSALMFTEQCSKKLHLMMTDEHKTLEEVNKAVEQGRPLDKFCAYLKTFQRDIHLKEGLLFNDHKMIVPVALRSPFMTLLLETHRGQFGMKALAENI